MMPVARKKKVNALDFRCNDCQLYFPKERIFDSMRRAELLALAVGQQLDLGDNPFAWMRCPYCVSANIGQLQDECDVEAGSIDTTLDTAIQLAGDLNSGLVDFENDQSARSKCIDILWNLNASVSRACELVREGQD